MKIIKITLITIATWYLINIIPFYFFYYKHVFAGVTDFPPHNYLFEVICRMGLFAIAGVAISTKVNGKAKLPFFETAKNYGMKYGVITLLALILWICYYVSTMPWRLQDMVGAIGQDVYWNFTDLGWNSLYICTQILQPSALIAYIIFFVTYFFAKSGTKAVERDKNVGMEQMQ